MKTNDTVRKIEENLVLLIQEPPETFLDFYSSFRQDKIFLPRICQPGYYKEFLNLFSIQSNSSIVYGFIFQYMGDFLENAVIILPEYRNKGIARAGIALGYENDQLQKGLFRVSKSNSPAIKLFISIDCIESINGTEKYLFYKYGKLDL
jgi:hypothetical protein